MEHKTQDTYDRMNAKVTMIEPGEPDTTSPGELLVGFRETLEILELKPDRKSSYESKGIVVVRGRSFEYYFSFRPVKG